MSIYYDWERAKILELVGPGRYTLIVTEELRDRVLVHYSFTPEDVPGLFELKRGELGHLDGMIIRRMTFPPLLLHPPPRPLQKPLPYPPRLRGRYAR